MGKCANLRCLKVFKAYGEKDWAPIQVDHDHKTNTVRALLCRGCNTALGLLSECPERLRGLIEYLNKHKVIV
jgi:hypothetical protein